MAARTSRPSVADHALRGLLWALGATMEGGSRFVPSLRAQVTRTFTFEMSAGPHVVRQWSFDGQRRRITTSSSRAVDAAHRVHFESSGRAIRRLLSPRAVDGIVSDWHHGRLEVQGSAMILLWFQGLTRLFLKIGREPGPRRPLPHPYVRHDPAANGVETILIEPAVDHLDPRWTAAWNARATLWMVRAASGEPMPEP